MVFSSQLFLCYFLPVALGLYYAAPRSARHLVLTLSSYVFYGWTNPLFIVLMLVSTMIDYVAGRVIAGWHPGDAGPPAPLERGGARGAAQRAALVVSIVSNLALLGFFKYYNFGIDSWNAAVSAFGLRGWHLDTVLRVTLPLGISFYTFQSMSYTIDVYRGDAVAVRSVTDFACFVSMFPQLVAGPIIRFQEVADQLRERRHTLEKFARGIAFLGLGLGKKVLLANPCGKVADAVFDAGSVAAPDAWYGVCAYAFQIYFDFSGYSDMAVGLGLMFGFVFAKNFDSPYRSASITEFWRRWHISLSTWLRDYLYIPLGGNRLGARRTYANLFLVMLLGGLWHGAAWNFLVWGALHGALLAGERLQGKRAPYRFLPPAARVCATFVLVLITWVFFRSPDLASALGYLGNMFGWVRPAPGAGLVAGVIYRPYDLLTMAIAAGVIWRAPQAWDLTRRLTWGRLAWVFVVFGLSAVALATQSFNPFIYFLF